MTPDLFDLTDAITARAQPLAPGAVVLRGHALPHAAALRAGLDRVLAQSPWRHMVTPGGYSMSVAMTNCGSLGWVTDRSGYRYDPLDPHTGLPWPRLPAAFSRLATQAAAEAGFAGFAADACLVNRYDPGSRLSEHQDRNERDYGAPIVSVSLGVAAVFLFGGTKRSDKSIRVPLSHGDVVVWGGPARLRYHAVMPLQEAHHPFMGAQRVNLTLRTAG